MCGLVIFYFFYKKGLNGFWSDTILKVFYFNVFVTFHESWIKKPLIMVFDKIFWKIYFIFKKKKQPKPMNKKNINYF